MSRLLCVLLAGYLATAHAEEGKNLFAVTKNFTTETTITWIVVANPDKVCNDTSIAKGYGSYPAPVDACAYWDVDKQTKKNVCTIITGTETSQNVIGHELRHCFAGNFHKAGENE
jgi:hypothetical protein